MSDELDEGDEGLVARTAQLLARGGLAASVSFAILVGGAAGLVLLGAFLSELEPPGVFSFAGPLLALASALLGLVQGHAAPLAAFALATEERPSLGAALRRALRCSWRVTGPTFLMFVPYMVGTCTFVALNDILAGSFPPSFFVVLTAIAGAGAALAAWIQGRWVLLVAASLVLERYDLAGPFGAREHLQLLAIGGIPVGTIVAFACQSLVRHVRVAPSLASSLDTFVTIATIVALAVAVIVSCAAAVAFATPRRARPSSSS